MRLSIAAAAAATAAGVWWVSRHDPVAVDLTQRLADPSWAHPLGRDEHGRDVLARVIAGAGVSGGFALLVLLACATLGTVSGMLAGWRGKLWDQALSAVVESLVAVPGVVIGLVFAAAFQPGLATTFAAVTVVGWVPFARLAQQLTRSAMHREYVLATRALGAGTWYVLRRAVLPDIARPLLAHLLLRYPHILMTMAGLSFLGVGVQPPVPEWGLMIAEAQPYLEQEPRLVLAPLAAVLATAGLLARLGSRVEQRWRPAASGTPGSSTALVTHPVGNATRGGG
ncbi:ABC transporter permease [Carbonactinospora thermoautotrophica]|uniref:ABC transporter permease n=1 Tax=Carbonactinospora thermoautotrophica TaxID=1469144 RepID=UPI00226DB598|nr:ABC transporter permease [Carbonactinospora thermoautotrophica]MCX9190366.1 ABC transporter permease [Carbonactinospora thermoautotrophica]